MHDQLAVFIGDATEELAEAFEEFGRFAGAAPLVLARGHARWKRRNFRRGFPVVEKLVHRNFEGARHFLQSLDARDGVAVLHARDLAALEASALLDIALRKVFLFADGT
jgi:hypothetical protein